MCRLWSRSSLDIINEIVVKRERVHDRFIMVEIEVTPHTALAEEDACNGH